MADDEDPRAGEATTANYGWTKPNVMGSDDAWGGMLNADLDGIDLTIKSVSNAIPAASSTTPAMDGAVAVGVGTTWARADHVHPTDTSRASVAQVNALPVAIGDNRIINGDMRIDQRNNGASGTASAYMVDRWQYNSTQASKGNWQRVPFNAFGFPYALAFASTSAYTPLAGDTFTFVQLIEADMITDFQWGSANAQPVTLSFWTFSSLTGAFGGSVRNGTRSYPFTFSIPVANTATRIIVTIPGDTAGTWVLSGNASGVQVTFDLGTGATYRGPAGTWASATYNGVTGAVSVVATNAATFYLTGVKLEIGSVATPFNRQSLAKSQADCERYFRWLPLTMQFVATVSNQSLQTPVSFSAMRATPTIAPISGDPNTTQSNTNNSGNSIVPQSPYGGVATLQATVAGGTSIVGYRASASAEL